MAQYSFKAQIDKFTIEDCRLYLSQWPKGMMSDYVRTRLATLEAEAGYQEQAEKDEDDIWDHSKHTIDGIKEYMSLFPQGKHIKECKDLVRKLRIEKETAARIESEKNQRAEDSIKRVIKTIGFIGGAILAIAIIVGCIETKTWPASGTLAPLAYGMSRLAKW